MKTTRLILVAALAALIPVCSYAQLDEHNPGLYTLIGDEYVPLSYSYAIGVGTGIGIGGVSISSKNHNYKGVTSGVTASDTFILVIDPKKISGTISPTKYNCFLKTMTPEDVLIVALETNEKKNRREYNSGLQVGVGISMGGGVSMGGTMNTSNKERAGIEYEQITDNSFKIKVPGLIPGEYGIILRPSKLGTFDYTALFGFTVPEPAATAAAAAPADTTAAAAPADTTTAVQQLPAPADTVVTK